MKRGVEAGGGLVEIRKHGTEWETKLSLRPRLGHCKRTRQGIEYENSWEPVWLGTREHTEIWTVVSRWDQELRGHDEGH